MKKSLALILACFCLPLFLEPVETATPTKWKVMPVLAPGDILPVLEKEFIEIGNYAISKSGLIVFWAHYQKKVFETAEWGLFAAKDGKVRLIARENDRTAPFGEKLWHISGQIDMAWRTRLTLAPGDNLVYMAGGGDEVWAVGDQDVRVLASKEALLKVGGRNINAKYFHILDSDSRGRMLVCFIGKGVNDGGLALFDESGPKKAWCRGDELPGILGAILDSTYIKVSESGAKLIPEGIIARLKVKGGPFLEALLVLTENDAKPIVAVGDPYPLQPDLMVTEIPRYDAASADQVVIHVSGHDNAPKKQRRNASGLYHYFKGSFTKICDNPLEIKTKGDRYLEKWVGGVFPIPGQPLYLFFSSFYDSFNYDMDPSRNLFVFAFPRFFNGQKTVFLTPLDKPFTEARRWLPGGGGFRGLLLKTISFDQIPIETMVIGRDSLIYQQGSLKPGEMNLEEAVRLVANPYVKKGTATEYQEGARFPYILKLKNQVIEPNTFLFDPLAPEKGFQQISESGIETVDGKKVSLGEILGWFRSGAYILREGGVQLLTRGE